MDKFGLPVSNISLSRRHALTCLLALAALPAMARAASTANTPPLRVGLTALSLKDPYGLMDDLRRYMEKGLGRRVEFVQRDSYRETMDLLRLEKLDFAWLCDYPYLHLQAVVRLLAVPVYQGRPYNRAYLIVPAGDADAHSILQLRGKVFAFVDPYSTTGYLSTRVALRQADEDPGHFFRKTFFAWSHRHVIEAVASGLAQAGSVDSYAWDSLAKSNPELTARTRVVSRSAEYGFPPLVAQRKVSDADFLRMQRLLLGMTADPVGRQLLERFNLDGFTAGDPGLYASVQQMMKIANE